MKKILVVIILLVAVIVIAPYFIGSTAETQIREQISKVADHPSYEVNIVEYDKGWFSSKALIELSIILPEEFTLKNTNNKIKIVEDIQHGPILWQGSGLALGLMDANIEFELPKELSDKIDNKVLFISSRTSFDLATNLHLKLLNFTLKEDSATLNIKDGFAELQYDMTGHIAGNLNWQGMDVVEDDKEVFNLGQITINTQQTLVSGEMFDPGALFVGFFKLNAAQIEVKGETEAEQILANDFTLDVSSDIKDELAHLTVVFAIDKLQAINQEFNHLTYDMALENLDVESLKAMNQIAVDNQGQDPMVMAAQFQTLLPKLIEKQPVFKVNQLGMKTKNGDIKSDLTISIDQSIYDINNPMTMMLAIVADAKGHAPEAFFNELGMTDSINMMLQQNLLIRDQQNLKFEFTFNNGQALINGTPAPLGGM